MSLIISPFKGLRYNSQKIKNSAEVVAPPYDVIDDKLREKLYAQSPFNVVRVILTKDEEGQAQNKSKYEVAQNYLEEWKKQEVLTRDEQPQLYVYHQTYTLDDGRKLTRKGYIAARRLESFETGRIRPHEHTFAGPKADRMHLIKATQANLSPIFGIYGDPGKKVLNLLENAPSKKLFIDITTDDGNRHQVWGVSDSETLKQVNEGMQDKIVFIADGHHRYETALGYRDYLRSEGKLQNETDAANFVMMYLCPMEDDGLVILPTHRVLVEKSKVSWATALEKIKKNFEVKEYAAAQSAEALKDLGNSQKEIAFLLSGDQGNLFLIKTNPQKVAQIESLAKIPEAVRNLDVTILHKYLLPQVFEVNLSEGDEAKKIHYVKDTQEALQAPSKGQASLSFILNPTKMSQVEEVSNIGERMPHKSTFFYPKLLSGLMFNPIGSSEKF